MLSLCCIIPFSLEISKGKLMVVNAAFFPAAEKRGCKKDSRLKKLLLLKDEVTPQEVLFRKPPAGFAAVNFRVFLQSLTSI